jgi:ribokinase
LYELTPVEGRTGSGRQAPAHWRRRLQQCRPRDLRRSQAGLGETIDTTGAGDAFIGSFARYLAAGLSFDAALEKGTRCAASSVTRRGAQKSFSTEAEFGAFCAKLG